MFGGVGGGLGSGGRATTPPPTPQAGRVTDSDGGGCERSSATLSTGQFIQKHRGGNSNVDDVTRIHYAPSPKALNFTARLLLRLIVSFHAFSYSAPSLTAISFQSQNLCHNKSTQQEAPQRSDLACREGGMTHRV